MTYFLVLKKKKKNMKEIAHSGELMGHAAVSESHQSVVIIANDVFSVIRRETKYEISLLNITPLI